MLVERFWISVEACWGEDNVFIYVFLFSVSLGDVTTQVSLQPALKFNGGGHINHSIFWTNLSPNGGGEPKG